MIEDIHIDCVDCAKDFVWTSGEQEYYRTKGFMPPKRCRECRESRKKELAASRSKEIVQTRYSATCDECGNETTVPFKPDKEKGPIYCKTCFDERKKDGAKRERR